MSKKIAVLLATYNGEKYIKEQLLSILSQKNINVTIFISDDMSTDKTLNIVKEYNDERIKILPTIKRMGSASQNFFRLIIDVDFSNYDYVAFADQDDIWYKYKLFNAIKKIEEKNVAGYSSNVIAFWKNGKRKLIYKSAKSVKYDFVFGSSGPGCTIVVKSDIMQEFKEMLNIKKNLAKKIDFHDWLIYAYIRSRDMDWFVDSRSSMDYRQHDKNAFGANSGWKSVFLRWKKARTGWYREQILLILEFCELTHLSIYKKLKRNNYLDRIVLSKDIFKFKKKKSEAIFLLLVFLIPGFR